VSEEVVMLYSFHELQRSFLEPFADLAGAAAQMLSGHTLLPSQVVRANYALLHRMTKTYAKPAFGIATVTAHGREVSVVEETLATRPFCRLVRFARSSDDRATTAALASDPRVLVCAPLSGHHATLVRDTVATLLQDHDVYVTDWIDAREVPIEAGPFHLEDYVAWIQGFLRQLGAKDLHVLSVCQPTVPVLAAISLMAAAGEDTPRTLTLMGGPIDARQNPTVVNKLATDKPITWFESNMIHRVPGNHPGRGRAVYPGFIQLTAFVMMNPTRHAEAYRTYWFDQLRGAEGAAAAQVHERFYDEYNAVLDMDAAYYLDTVRTVFQDFALARGTWDIAGERVRPAAITTTALLTIEGAHDDISGLGQTEAAHALCSGIPASRKRHYVESCGHYGLFSGHRWRDSIYPELRSFIRTHGTP
jgi:poly(3-hydroxybutyrate) depolymerase